MLYSDKEIEIKRKIINIIKTFRSLGLLTDSDITITELTKTTNQYDVTGEYNYKTMFNYRFVTNWILSSLEFYLKEIFPPIMVFCFIIFHLTYRALAKCIFRLIWLRINKIRRLFILYTNVLVWHALPYLKNPYTRLTYFSPV